MSTDLRVPSANVLKNRGVPVFVHRLVTDPETGRAATPYERAFTGEGDAGEPVYDEVFIQFTTSVLVDMENPETGWGNLDEWQEQLGTLPTSALAKTIAFCLELFVPGAYSASGYPLPDLRRAGKMMLDGRADDYATAVGAAFALANGVSAERAGEVLRAGVRQAKDIRPLIDAELGRALDEEMKAVDQAIEQMRAGDATPTGPTTGTPGGPGSEAGSETVVTPTSSGD